MRSPEHRIAHPRAGKHFEDELQLRYMSPGAFTVLPPDDNPPPDPPTAPEPYRLTPSTRRHKKQSFAIIGEVDTSRPNSRSPSPTGRVSPFRGRGFNPTGSRHASPNPSPPPPEDARLTPTNLSPQHASKIPKLKRKGSNLVFGEKIIHYEAPQARGRLDTQLSQSMTNLEVKNVATRPPQSPRKNVYSKTPAFQRLSPIVGSSPEPSQSLSSPSRIPKSRSTPPSRRTSPTRTIPTLAGKPPPSKNSSRTLSRSHSRSQSRSQSRSASREPSPAKNPMSPTRIPVSKYKNVQAKVNTNNKPKPKVPPKPQVLSEQSEESSDVSQIVKNKPVLSRKESVNKIRTNSRSNLLSKTENNNNNINNNASDSSSSMVGKINKNSTKSNIGSHHTSGAGDKTTREKKEEKIKESSQKGDNVTTNEAERRKNSNSDALNTKDITEKKRNNNIDSSLTTKDVTEKSRNNNVDNSLNEKRKTNSRSSSPTKEIPERRKNHNTDSVLTRKDSRRDITKVTNAGATDSPYSIKKTTDSSSEQYGSPVKSMDRQRKNSESPVKLADILPSTTTVVTSTTSTVTQPLKIETNLNLTKPVEKPKPVSPMVDGRVLSATSVSNAMNKMNDSVLNTQTVFKDHGFTKLSPAANAVISVANETGKPTNPALDTKHATSALPTVEPVLNKPDNIVIDIGNNFRGNNHTNHVTHAGFVSSKALEMEVQRNMSRLISPEHNNMGNSVQKSLNDRIKEARTVVAADVKPIRITVKEKPSDVEVQSGNVRPPVSVSNGLNERPGLPPAQQTPPNEPVKETPPKNACARFFSTCGKNMSCQCCKKEPAPEDKEEEEVEQKKGCFGCMKKKEPKEESVRINIEDESEKKPSVWDKLKCCNKHKVRDTNCFPTGKRKDSWVERRDSILSDPSQQQTQPRSRCSRDCCKGFFRKLFCMNLCCKKKIDEDPISRKASIISKKKSLTPTTAPPPEDTGPKIDLSLVEHSSAMKGAIPVLPICLAWFCLIMNCIAPGTGTLFSGFFCLCIGKPRFSQKDGAKQRIGSFFINAIIGFGQFFTVLFCLVGWGWSIWWGLIMLRIARKHKKLKHLQAIEDASSRPVPVITHNHHSRDPQRNS